MSRARRILPLLLGPLLLAGCLEIHYNLKVSSDLAGTAQVQVIFEGQEDQKITPEVVDAYRKQQAEQIEKTKAEIAAQFPAGVRLKSYDFVYVGENQGGQELLIGFDRVDQLSKIQDTRTDPGRQPGLQGIEVEVEELEDETLQVTIRQRVTQKNVNQQEDPLAEQMKGKLEGKNARYVYEVPGEVVSTTAHEQEGNVLTWEWPMKALLYETEERTVEVTFKVAKPEGWKAPEKEGEEKEEERKDTGEGG